MMHKKTFYITTPIYYPSGKLHIGHAYTTTLAWAIKNYKRLKGFESKLLTGADEHGQKIQQKSKENGITEQKYVNNMHLSFMNLWKKLNIDFDYYSRTTNKQHKESVQKIFSKLLKKGAVYKGLYKGLYSIQDEEFFTKNQASEKNGKYYHPVSGNELEEVAEESYFLKISKFSNWLKKEHNQPNFIKPHKTIKELRNSFIDKGLEDLSVTRTSFNWGVKVKEDPKHIIYVWLDALTSYINTLGYLSNNDNDYQKYWVNGNEKVHLVGKEITRFHCIYWPIILKALNLPQPNVILSHGWIITSEGKMSKSKGNVIDPDDLIEEFGDEVLKYYLASQIHMNKDGIFNRNLLINTYNSDLANNYGNLLSRTIAMILQSFNKPIKFKKTHKNVDKNIIDKIIDSKEIFEKYFNEFKVSKAYEVAMKLSKFLNGYIDKTEPWQLKGDKERLSQVLNVLLNGIYAVSVYLSTIMPNKMKLAAQQINIFELSLELINDFKKFDNIIVKKGEVLFRRIK